MCFGILKAGESGYYTLAPSRVMDNLVSKFGLFLELLIVVELALMYRQHRKAALTWNAAIKLLLPSTAIASYMAVFLQWSSLGHFHLVIVAPFVGVVAAHFVTELFPKRASLVALIVLAIGISLYRCTTMYLRLHDIREIVEAAPGYYTKGLKKFYSPCGEIAHGMNIYLASSGIRVMPLSEIQQADAHEAPSSQSPAVLFSASNCPLPARLNRAECKRHYYYQSALPRWGYELAKIECARKRQSM